MKKWAYPPPTEATPSTAQNKSKIQQKQPTKKQNWTETMFVHHRNMLPEQSEQIQAKTCKVVRSLLQNGNEIVSDIPTH